MKQKKTGDIIPDFILSMPGCETCKFVKKELKRKENFKKIKIVSTATKKGYEMAMKSKTTLFPQCITLSKKGIPKRCNTKKFLKKFKIKIK